MQIDAHYLETHPAYAEALLRYAARRYGQELFARQTQVDALHRDSFAKQQAFILDESPMTLALCGRRAGKTTAVERKLLRNGLRAPNNFSLYLALTRRNAKLLLWPELKELNRRYSLGGKPNESDLTLTLPNRHTIMLGGADTESEIDKYRQFKLATAAVDEAGAMGPWLRELVESVLEPATVDTRGQIILCGTPATSCDGMFWDLSGNPEYAGERPPVHRWTMLDNPFIVNAEAWLADLIRRRGWDDDNATLNREYRGLWVPDLTALCYAYDAERNGWDGVLPPVQYPWEYTLGVDVGYDDPTAFVLLAYAKGHPNAYVVSAEKHPQWEPTQIGARIDEFLGKYPITRIVMDAGGGGKGTLVEWARRYRVPLHAPPAKNAKKAHIKLLNDDLQQGLIKVAPGQDDLTRELVTVCWDSERKSPDKKYPNDACDALEYAWVSSFHFVDKDTKKPKMPPKTQEELYAKEEAAIELAALRKARAANRRRARGLAV